jgi:hypothetical protein
MAGSVSVSEEVRAALREPAVERLVRDAAGEFVCVSCSLPGSTEHGDDVALIMFRHPDDKIMIKIAHELCLSSRIIDVDSPMRAEEMASRPVDVTTLPVVLAKAGGGLYAALIVERTAGMSIVSDFGDTVDPWIAALLADGWALSAALGQQPQRLKGWKLTLDRTTGTGTILQPGGHAFLDALTSIETEWAKLAVRQQEVSVFACSDVGLATVYAERSSGDIANTLAGTAAAGNLVAARMQVVSHRSTPRAPVSGDQQMRHDLAGAIKTGLQERARPGQPATGGLNAAPEFVALPVRPKLMQTLVGGYPVLVVDLAGPEAQEDDASAVLGALSRVGFRDVRSFTEGPLALPPEGWGYILWRSQIAIFDSGSEGHEVKKFLFEPLSPAVGWYDAVKESPAGSLGFLVGDLGVPTDADPSQFTTRLNHQMAAGRVIGAALTGMCAS